MNIFQVSYGDHIFKDRASITIVCLPGYEVGAKKETNFNATCEASGQWSGLKNCTGKRDYMHSACKCLKCKCLNR